MKKNDEIKYCVVGFIDLQGFSSHLAVGGDLRTIIGRQAIERLEILENALEQIKKEEKRNKKLYPKQWECKRINDSLIFTVDLPKPLLPDIGGTIKEAWSEREWEEYFDITGGDLEEFNRKYYTKRQEFTDSLVRFVGLVSRVHQIISLKEREKHFPGVKTVLSTGFRRSYIGLDGNEDHLSANFAFSNAYLAQEKLKGASFYMDVNVLKLLDADLYTYNIAKLSCYVYNEYVYSPVNDPMDMWKVWKESSATEIILFHKKYYFKQINPSPLTYLQFTDNIKGRMDVKSYIVETIVDKDLNSKLHKPESLVILKLPYDLAKMITKKRKKKK